MEEAGGGGGTEMEIGEGGRLLSRLYYPSVSLLGLFRAALHDFKDVLGVQVAVNVYTDRVPLVFRV